MIPEATHQPVLFEVVKHTNKPILEYGAGLSSTRQLHEATQNPILTLDDIEEWVNNFADLKDDRHNFLYLPEGDTKKFFDEDTEDWGVVLIDSSTWYERLLAIKKYKDVADYVVIHDADWACTSGTLGKRVNNKNDFSEIFTYWVEYQRIGIEAPTTLLGSNKIDVRKIHVNGAIRLAQSH